MGLGLSKGRWHEISCRSLTPEGVLCIALSHPWDGSPEPRLPDSAPLLSSSLPGPGASAHLPRVLPLHLLV